MKTVSVRRDIVLMVIVAGAAAYACAKFNLSEALLKWTRPFERLQLDELPAVLLVVAISLIWFSTRRYLEANRQLQLRRAAESQLAASLAENKRLAQQYVDVQESERKALARDLHDELGQYLNAIKLDAVSIREAAAAHPGVREAARAMIANIDRVYAAVTGLIRQLRPVGFDELGVAAALEHCVKEWRLRLPAVTIELKVSGDFEALDEARGLVLYRLVQEALTNIARHSHATQVEIRIAADRAMDGAPCIELSHRRQWPGCRPARAAHRPRAAWYARARRRPRRIDPADERMRRRVQGRYLAALDRQARMNPAAKRITVLLVDDHAVVREGYRRLLERDDSLVVVGEAATAADAMRCDGELKPDVLVLDIALPGVSGIEVLRRIIARRPAACVLMFSMYQDGIYASRALNAGARGYLSKASAPDLLVEAVRSVAQGRRYVSPDVEHAMTAQSSTASQLAGALSTRELEVLRMLVQGYGVEKIGERLGLSPKTAANHQSSIKQKLGAESALQLVLIAKQLGLITDL